MNKRLKFILGLTLLLILSGGCQFFSAGTTSEEVHSKGEKRSAGSEPSVKEFRTVLVYSDQYDVDLGGLESFHSFDIHKYKKIHRKLLEEKIVTPKSILTPEEISEENLLRIHSKEYLENLRQPQKLMVYLESPVAGLIPAELVDQFVLTPFRAATGGTLLAARTALEQGIAINLGGGYHHAKPEKGEGFCLYADMPIAIRTLQAEGLIQRALIIDLDAHQGNGTIVCLADDESTYCVSLHQGDIYPIPKEKGDWDLELEAGTDDQKYLKVVEQILAEAFEKAGEPEIVFYQAGCDPLETDPLASLKMTKAGIVKRDLMVLEACSDRGIPVVMTLGGGYSDRAWEVQYESIRSAVGRFGSAPAFAGLGPR